jgi:membrane protease YdiL (CAAX protease family)
MMEERVSDEPRTAATGAPGRPLLEAVLVFAAFYLATFLPMDAAVAGESLSRPSYHLFILLELVPKALLLLYLMARSEGLAEFGVLRPRPVDLLRAAMTALGAGALVLAAGAAAKALGADNPLLEAAAGGDASPVLLPFIAMTGLSVGYSEELFFRVYLMRRLGQAGLAPPWAALASALAFGSAHGLQGPLGIAMGSLLGLWFAYRWARGRNLHDVALGHAIYDIAVMCAVLFG